jgi:hypothetical protein
MGMSNIDNVIRVWRLATATRPAQQVCAEPALRAGRWHDVGDRVLYAYESEELAALSLSQLTQGVEPARLVHESLDLPADPTLHAEFNVAGEGKTRRAFYTPGEVRLPIVNLSALMRERHLLTLWVTSPYTTQQRTVLINADHPAFGKIRIESHVLPGASFFSTGPCGSDVADAWAQTDFGADEDEPSMQSTLFQPREVGAAPCF